MVMVLRHEISVHELHRGLAGLFHAVLLIHKDQLGLEPGGGFVVHVDEAGDGDQVPGGRQPFGGAVILLLRMTLCLVTALLPERCCRSVVCSPFLQPGPTMSSRVRL